MSDARQPLLREEADVPMSDVERALLRLLRDLQGSDDMPVVRACMSNLVIFCKSVETARQLAPDVYELVLLHPARVLLLINDPHRPINNCTASVRVQAHRNGGPHLVSFEQITLHAAGASVHRLPYIARSLLVGDLPINVWWAAADAPTSGGEVLYDLGDHAQQIMYDSLDWPDPLHNLAVMAPWLAQIKRAPHEGGWRIASDLNWQRLRYWQRLIAQALEPVSAPGALQTIREVQIEHGPHALTQAWLLTSWLGSRLGWRIRTGRMQPGVEFTWCFTTTQSEARVFVRRLDKEPPEVLRIRIACKVRNREVVLHAAVQDGHRLAVVPEGLEGTPRTLTVPPESRAVLLGRQLSDREYDPIFRESMAFAQQMAQAVVV